ncbi:uncharacterized protein KZ484_023283 isoform 4-T8 [Pholidichthys leucotaenia]
MATDTAGKTEKRRFVAELLSGILLIWLLRWQIIAAVRVPEHWSVRRGGGRTLFLDLPTPSGWRTSECLRTLSPYSATRGKHEPMRGLTCLPANLLSTRRKRGTS